MNEGSELKKEKERGREENQPPKVTSVSLIFLISPHLTFSLSFSFRTKTPTPIQEVKNVKESVSVA
jgi:hypothetical protein